VEIKVKEKAFLSLCNNRTRVNTVYDFSPPKKGKKRRENQASLINWNTQNALCYLKGC